jgi:hypothetical protein
LFGGLLAILPQGRPVAMRRSSRQIAGVIPRGVAQLLALALLAGACTSGPSAARKSADSQAAKQHAIADAELHKAVQAIKLCARQNDGEYPPAVKNQPGPITMLCGPVSQTIQLRHGDRLTYRPRHGGFTLKITDASGAEDDYGVGGSSGGSPSSGAPSS